MVRLIILIHFLIITQKALAIKGGPKDTFLPAQSDRHEREPSHYREHLNKKDTCLTGYMTDVQSWVDKTGYLSTIVDRRLAIDLTGKTDPVTQLAREIHRSRGVLNKPVKYLSLSRCNLKRVPTVFQMTDKMNRNLYSTVEYITLYGNNFTDISVPKVHYGETMNASNAKHLDFGVRRPAQSAWAFGFNQVTFTKLKELDLRKCSIQQLTDNVFNNMPTLEALYLGENNIVFLSANAFHGLKSLKHLDLSKNNQHTSKAVALENLQVFQDMQSLISLDLSMTTMLQHDVHFLSKLSVNLQRLSICRSGLTMLPNRVFNNTNLKYLDVSYNNGILSASHPFRGLEDTIEIIYAKDAGVKTYSIFTSLTKLRVVDLEKNELTSISRNIAQNENLIVLNLDSNRLTSWFSNIFKPLTSLNLLSLRDNNINLVSKEMLRDFQNISYIGLSGNFMVCNCHSRELFELAYRNQNTTTEARLISPSHERFTYHTAYHDFEKLIQQRREVTRFCSGKQNCSEYEEPFETDGNFRLFDYDVDSYKCRQVTEAKTVSFSDVRWCGQTKRDTDLSIDIPKRIDLLYLLLLIPLILTPILIFCFTFRRNMKYFCIMMRNTATLSLLNKDKVVDDGTIFNYDVFVSYCNEDRDWVLDHLLPNVEKDCNVSVCLHERDFQVGLSILENIVFCMDRSRYIMLILSQRFLLSQWCQFEMHLAQHRLLETRREDLILVLLEDIPRAMRPTTLHYLMLTKTYIVWPKLPAEESVFWRRMKRTLLAHRMRTQENVSLA